MRRLTILMIGVAVLTFGAGIVAEKLTSHLQASDAGGDNPAAGQTSWILQPLRLNDQQTQHMRGIWESVNDAARDCENQRSSLRKDCDQAVFSLLTPEQKTQYNQKMTEYQTSLDDVDKRQREAFRKGVQQTNAILTPQQQDKYRQILKENVGYGVGTGPGLDNASTSPATRPAAAN